jgi:hypothetical protein
MQNPTICLRKQLKKESSFGTHRQKSSIPCWLAVTAAGCLLVRDNGGDVGSGGCDLFHKSRELWNVFIGSEFSYERKSLSVNPA